MVDINIQISIYLYLLSLVYFTLDEFLLSKYRYIIIPFT